MNKTTRLDDPRPRRCPPSRWGVLCLALGSASAACWYQPDPPEGGIDGGADAGPGFDVGMIPVLNACTTDMFVDRSTGDRTISFGSQNGSPLFGFAPPCVRITVGQSVTFSGSFNTHPLSPGTTMSTTAGSPGNPIMPTATGNSLMVSFPSAGLYPYYCEMHGAAGMAGVVLVQ